jgi:hypothetical protein
MDDAVRVRMQQWGYHELCYNIRRRRILSWKKKINYWMLGYGYLGREYYLLCGKVIMSSVLPSPSEWRYCLYQISCPVCKFEIVSSESHSFVDNSIFLFRSTQGFVSIPLSIEIQRYCYLFNREGIDTLSRQCSIWLTIMSHHS